MPSVYLVVFVLLLSVTAFASDEAVDPGCVTCNIFRKQVDISDSRQGVPDAVRPPVFTGGRVAMPDASEQNFNYGHEPSAIRIVPTNVGGTVSVKRLSHKPPKAAKKAYEEAVRLSAKGQSLEAIALLQKAIQLDPEYMEALNNLGARYILIGEYERALPHLNKAIELDAHSVQPYCNLSLAYLGTGDAAAAERAARQSIANDPNEERGRYLLGVSLIAQRKQVEEATQHLRRAQDHFPQAKFAIGIAEAMAGNTAAAKASLTEYLSSNQAPKRQEAEELLHSLQAKEQTSVK
jgi:tetratricopeptide (TPR) repeat protein